MKYHPASDTIVPPFNEYLFPSDEMYDLIVDPMPDMNGGDTVLAKPPVLDGDSYRMAYCLLSKDSPAQSLYLETKDAAAAIALAEAE